MSDTIPQPPAARRIPPLAWLLLGALALIWGTSFLSNRIALREAPVLAIVALRIAGAAALLWLWVGLRGLKVPRNPMLIVHFAVMGLINNTLPFALIVWGQQHIDSGLAAILNASSAIFGVLVAALCFADEKLTLRRALGVAVGFAGVVLAIGPEALHGLSLTSAGQFAIIGSSISYGFGAAYARRATRGVPPEVAAAGMLSAATIWAVAAMLWFEGLPTFDWSAPVWTAIVWLTVPCTAAAYLIYYRILALAGAGNLMLVTLIIPPVAILAGWAVFGERLHLAEILGFVVIALGLAILNGASWPGQKARDDRAARR